MKKVSKISLTELSKSTLDKIQQTAINGGGIDHCICAYFCGSNCNCTTPGFGLLEVSNIVTEDAAYVVASETKGGGIV